MAYNIASSPDPRELAQSEENIGTSQAQSGAHRSINNTMTTRIWTLLAAAAVLVVTIVDEGIYYERMCYKFKVN